MGYMEVFGYSIVFKELENEKGNPIKAQIEKKKREYRSLISH